MSAISSLCICTSTKHHSEKRASWNNSKAVTLGRELRTQTWPNDFDLYFFLWGFVFLLGSLLEVFADEGATAALFYANCNSGQCLVCTSRPLITQVQLQTGTVVTSLETN